MTAVANWFCLRSQPKHEHIAAGHLRKMDGVEVFLPRIRFQRTTRQGLVWVTEALFPNYLFARFDWHLSLRQVQAARRGQRRGAFWSALAGDRGGGHRGLKQAIGPEELHVISATLHPGDAVEIAEGAMRGLHAVVSRVLPSRARVAVLLEFLGRQTTIEVPANLIIKEGDVRDGFFPAGGLSRRPLIRRDQLSHTRHDFTRLALGRTSNGRQHTSQSVVNLWRARLVSMTTSQF